MSMLRTIASARNTTIVALGLALAACDGSSPTPTPTPSPTSTSTPAPANHAPIITSGDGSRTPENVGGLMYQATATDADGDPITFSLSGADAEHFTISGTGAIHFVWAPNFDRPIDADADNVYSVQLTASDGKAAVNKAVTITVLNSKEGVAVTRSATGFDHPVAILGGGGNLLMVSQLMVAELSGTIYFYDLATRQRAIYASVEGLTNAPGQGIFSIAVQPTSPNRFVVYALIARNGRVAVRRIVKKDGTPSWIEFDLGPRTAHTNNIGGWIGFGTPRFSADGGDWEKFLYVATGDAGGTSDPSGSAQSSTSLFGKLLSFSPSAFDAVADGAAPSRIVPTIRARGLRYPTGGAFFTDDELAYLGTRYPDGLLLPDRGQSMREEVNFMPVKYGTIDNFGWPYREGTGINTPGEPTGLIAPVLEYPHGSGARAGQQIVAGIVYHGYVPSLKERYIFLDRSGAIFTIPLVSLMKGTTVPASALERRDLDFAPNVGTITKPVSITQDVAGTIYIACENGDIFSVSPIPFY